VPQYVLDAVRAAGLAAATAFEYPTTAEQARAISSASHRVLIDYGYPDALPCIFCAKRSKKMRGADLHLTLRTECTINLTELVVIAKMKGAPAAPPIDVVHQVHPPKQPCLSAIVCAANNAQRRSTYRLCAPVNAAVAQHHRLLAQDRRVFNVQPEQALLSRRDVRLPQRFVQQGARFVRIGICVSFVP
jgi:hypothetical protein